MIEMHPGEAVPVKMPATGAAGWIYAKSSTRTNEEGAMSTEQDRAMVRALDAIQRMGYVWDFHFPKAAREKRRETIHKVLKTLLSAHRTTREAEHEQEAERLRAAEQSTVNECNRLQGKMITLRARCGKLEEEMRLIAPKYTEALAILERFGWKYESIENLDQKVTFSVYSLLVECCQAAQAVIDEADEAAALEREEKQDAKE
jgi:crotonobetainyl-CoA:carnitine CoA-transferase CaiB-like acyl-CoA transferase